MLDATKRIVKVFARVGSDIHPTNKGKMDDMRAIIAKKFDLSEDDVLIAEHTVDIVVQLEDGGFVQIF